MVFGDIRPEDSMRIPTRSIQVRIEKIRRISQWNIVAVKVQDFLKR